VTELPALELFQSELGSGIRLSIAPLPSVHRAAVSLHVKSGPRYEPAELGGISHFLEHMLHRGIPGHPTAHAQALAFEDLGSELSAATYADHTVLSASGPPETIGAVLSLLGEVCRSPLFGDIEVERGIVREEILESSNDRGMLVDPDDLVVEGAFPEHALGRPITGTVDALERFDVAALRRVHAAHYVGSGLCVTVAGPVSPKEIEDIAERAFAGLPRGAALTDTAPAPLDGPGIVHARDTTTQTALRVAFRAPGQLSPNEVACELLLRLLDDGMSTRLYRRICDELGLAYDVSASYEAFEGIGLVTLASECAHARVPELLGELLAIVSNLRDHGPTASELDKARRRASWQLRALVDDPDQLAAFIGLSALTGRSPRPEQRLAELHAVDRDRLIETAASVFRRESLVVAAVGQQTPAQRRKVDQVVRGFR
jgi:predicted Zn-dependent peptidase